MEISIRSQMAAGVAVAGTVAVALIPIVHPEMAQLRQVTAEVQLTLVNPVSELIASLNLGTNYLFATDAGAFPYLQGQVLEVLPQDPRVPVPTRYVIGQGATAPLGWIPQLFGGWTYTTKIYLDRAGTQPAPPPEDTVTTTMVGGFPLASAVATNLSGYLDAAVLGVTGLVGGLGAAAIAIPLAAVQIVADLIAGQMPDFEAILSTITTPITDGLEAALGAGTYILTNLITRVTAGLPLPPAVGVALVQQAISSAIYLGNSLTTTLGDAIGNLPDVELAFDTVVQGLLGPTGFAGDLVELTVGRGVETGDPDNPFIGSVRSLVSGVTGATSGVIVNAGVPSALAGASVDPASAEPVADLDVSTARAALEDGKSVTATGDSDESVATGRSQPREGERRGEVDGVGNRAVRAGLVLAEHDADEVGRGADDERRAVRS